MLKCDHWVVVSVQLHSPVCVATGDGALTPLCVARRYDRDRH